MKSVIKRILQRLFGLEHYLNLFARFIIFTLPFNKNERDFLTFNRLIKKKGIILDIGANIGVMTYYLSKHHPDSLIFAFEPVPINIKTLEGIVENKKLKNVKIFTTALGDEETIGQIILPEVENVVMQGLSHIEHESITDFNDGKKFDVQIQKLDNITEIEDTSNSIVGIKMDVENFEYFVLLGGKMTIEKHKPLIYMELWENDNRNHCLDFLTSLGYLTFTKQKGRMTKFDPDHHKSQNFFFIHSTDYSLLNSL